MGFGEDPWGSSPWGGNQLLASVATASPGAADATAPATAAPAPLTIAGVPVPLDAESPAVMNGLPTTWSASVSTASSTGFADVALQQTDAVASPSVIDYAAHRELQRIVAFSGVFDTYRSFEAEWITVDFDAVKTVPSFDVAWPSAALAGEWLSVSLLAELPEQERTDADAIIEDSNDS